MKVNCATQHKHVQINEMWQLYSYTHTREYERVYDVDFLHSAITKWTKREEKSSKQFDKQLNLNCAMKNAIKKTENRISHMPSHAHVWMFVKPQVFSFSASIQLLQHHKVVKLWI